MKPETNISTTPDSSRRGFITKLPMAAAALTLCGSFGFPTTTAQGDGRLYMKITGVAGEAKMFRDGIYQFSSTEIDKLKTGRFQSIKIKLELSTNQKNWQKITTNVNDTTTIRQLSTMAKKI